MGTLLLLGCILAFGVAVGQGLYERHHQEAIDKMRKEVRI